MNRTKPEDDEYWNSTKCNAFTFDDDDDDFTKLKESKRAVNSILVDDDDDDDDVEKVSWSGEPVGSISWSVKETASSIRSGGEQSFPKINTAPSLPKQGSGYSLSSLFRAKSKPSFSESFIDTSARVYAPELRKPKSECQDYVSDRSPEETVRRMRKGKAYSMERFRSLQDKLLLLDEAVSAHDGNVITAVLIYLKKSLSKEILFRELMLREIALRHYIHYLKEMGEQKLLVELMKALGRTEDMALMQYKEHMSIKDENKRRDFLKKSLSLPFSQEDATHVQDHYTLLERQIIIEANDKKGDAEIFKKFPRKASILNMPIITTLYYSCFYHYGEPEGTFSSPANIRKTFRISEKQYILTALGARAKLKNWFDVDSLFNTKTWLGYTKKKSPVGFHRVVDILQKNNAPVQVLQTYMTLIDDSELKLSLAHKYKCHDVVIDTYRDLKDRQKLIVYQGKLERSSDQYRKIEEILNNTRVKTNKSDGRTDIWVEKKMIYTDILISSYSRLHTEPWSFTGSSCYSKQSRQREASLPKHSTMKKPNISTMATTAYIICFLFVIFHIFFPGLLWIWRCRVPFCQQKLIKEVYKFQTLLIYSTICPCVSCPDELFYIKKMKLQVFNKKTFKTAS